MFKILAPLALILVPILHNLGPVARFLTIEDLSLVVATGIFLKHPHEVRRDFRLTLETIETFAFFLQLQENAISQRDRVI
jgi:hypothetical protein